MASKGGNVVPFIGAGGPDTGVPDAAVRIRRSRQQDTAVPGTVAITSAAPSLGTATQMVTLQDLGNGMAFVHPLYVRLEQAGDEHIATSLDLGLAGVGDSDVEALDDLRGLVAELFESLLEMRSSLGPHLQNQLAFLERLAGQR